MSEYVIIQPEQGIIQVVSTGEATLREMTQSLITITRLRREHGFTRVLVDARGITRFPGTYPIFQFGTRLAAAIGGLKVAIVGTEAIAEDLELIEDVAVNRGAVVEVFFTEEHALRWLTASRAASMQPVGTD